MKNKIPLIIGITLPILLIIFVLLMVTLPSVFANPRYQFLYSDATRDYRYEFGYFYDVSEGKLVKVPYPAPYGGNVKVPEVPVRKTNVLEPKLFGYDPKVDQSREVSFEEAQKFVLEIGSKSPDGYTLEYGGGHNGIFEIFGGSYEDRNTVYLKKGFASKKVYLNNPRGNYYYYDNSFFLGWVINPQ